MRWLLLFLLLIVFAACQPEPPTAVPAATAVSTSPPTRQPPATPTPLPPMPTTTSTPLPTPTPTPAYPVYAGPPLPQDRLGIQVHLMDREQADIWQHLEALGVGWVKVQFSWKLYEPEPGRYHDGRFAELDRFIAGANQRGVHLLLSVSKAPEWSRPTTELDGPPADFALYERLMADLAARYRGRVAAYELWNEPNLQREWNGFPLGGAEFTALLARGAAGVRAGDAAALVVAGAPAVTGIDDRVTAVADRTFLAQMLDAGAAGLVDAVGVHPYGFANPPGSSMDRPGSTPATSHNNHPTFFFADTLNDYRRLLDDHNLVQMPLWVTEFGWGSFENVAAVPPAVAYMAEVTEWQQAVYTLQAISLAQSWGVEGPLILWNLNFGPLLGTEFAESGYSLLRPDGTKRPLYFSLATAPKE